MKRITDEYSRKTHRDDAKIKTNVLRKEEPSSKPKKPVKSAPKPAKTSKVNVTKYATISKTLQGVRR